jgi:hypothetical protein
MRRTAETTVGMSIRRSLHLSLLLSLISACTIDKGPLDSSSSSDGASESAEATSTPTTSTTSIGDETTGTSTGDPGTSTEVGTGFATTIDIDTDDTGFATTIDIDTDDTGVATTTGGPDESELVVFPGGEPMCMPVCVNDEEPETEVLQPNCQVFEIDVDAQTQHELMPCDEVQLEWVIPAGQVRCFAELIDTGNQTLSEADDIGETCLATGLNLEFLVVASEPAPPGVVFGAICEPSDNPALHCPNA